MGTVNRYQYWKKSLSPNKNRENATEKGLLAYIVDFDTEGRTNETYKREVGTLLRQCIQQKIFSASKDFLGVTRTDAMQEFQFGPIKWDLLRELDTKILQPETQSRSKKPAIQDIFGTVFALMDAQAEEDEYNVRKILFVSEFQEKLKEEDIRTLVESIDNEKVFVTFIAPGRNLTEAQLQNLQTLTNRSEGNEFISIRPLDEVRLELNNTVCKKPVRPTPWNIALEIGGDLTINVSGYVCTRKNKSSETKAALLKSVASLPPPTSTSTGAPTDVSGTVSVFGGTAGSSSASRNDTITEAQNTATAMDVELASKVVNKEEHWEQNDGTIIDPENIVDGYYYGDKLVSFDEIQKSASYTTGEKCFKVLLFCPKEQISPYFLLDDGTDLFYARKNERDSDLIFTALLQVLHKSGKVAVVRKIRSKDAKLSIGVLSPDLERRCLVYVNLAFADDVTLPKFPQLFKPHELENNKISEKDALMDQFIASKSIDTFTPFEGPVDPAVQVFRENITRKILGKSSTSTSVAAETTDSQKTDTIQAFFDNLIKQNSATLDMNGERETQKQLCLTFPCREIEKKGTDRAAGVNVFRKRNLSSSEEAEDDKKIKVEPPSLNAEKDVVVQPSYGDQFELDNLMDDM